MVVLGVGVTFLVGATVAEGVAVIDGLTTVGVGTAVGAAVSITAEAGVGTVWKRLLNHTKYPEIKINTKMITKIVTLRLM